MKIALNACCFFAMGATLASGGITWNEWQSFVVLVLAAAIATISEIME